MAEPNKNRIQSLDILRGTVMVIMALDHVRDFFYNPTGTPTGAALDPTNMETTFPALFFTRWITHFCAPVFVFLAGASAYLMGQRKTKKEVSAFLVKRGLWLIAVEVILVTLAISYDPLYRFIFLQVIWVIGCSLIILGLLIHLPYRVILAIGLSIVFLHNLLNFVELPRSIWTDMLYSARFSVYPYAPGRVIVFLYALVPWCGIMLLGYCFGKLYMPSVTVAVRKRKLLWMGLGLVGLFVVLRTINIYGDPVRWSVQHRGPVYTFLSFLNVNKYPPSLLYFCVTIGGGMLALWAIEGANNAYTRVMNVFGRVPFFYYVLHFYLIHGLLVILFYGQGFTNKDIVNPDSPFMFTPAGLGVPLFWVYVIWALVIVIMYPLCRKYNAYKAANHQWWLSYL